MNPYLLISAIVAFCFCFFPSAESPRAAGDPVAQKQQEMDRLLSRQRLDQIERDQRLDHYLLYRLQQDLNQLQLEQPQDHVRQRHGLEQLEGELQRLQRQPPR